MSKNTVRRTQLVDRKFLPGQGEVRVFVTRAVDVDAEAKAHDRRFESISLWCKPSDGSEIQFRLSAREARALGNALLRVADLKDAETIEGIDR